MPYLLMFMMSIAISMALTALLARHAVALGMIDRPDGRKVHSVPVPRVGGVGIVVGALIPILLWLPTSRASRGYVLGAAILLVFGVWDDRKELGHYVKFVGQFAAAAAVVYYGGLYVS
ncbi:MAG TPA: undecaprenyl/decaprenyl-phosphate alpha-N-acetylglucosaminyl 1-phosphate transferase, partial [Rhizobiales bacterium]|nr:undecaprenyl/decaprenyl-phosphate alpha-N-acetylglucosaminyl 1-phosphate transferase [Hyphomicrobiales bacterium]